MKRILLLITAAATLFLLTACEDPNERRIRELDESINLLDEQIAAKQNEMRDVQERFDRIEEMRKQLGY